MDLDDSLAAQRHRRSIQAERPFSANVEMDASLPTLLLEDINEHLEEVRCTSSTIELDFEDPWIASAVQQAAQHSSKVIVITSHVDCNVEGERKPHMYVVLVIACLLFRSDSVSVHEIEISASSLTLQIMPTSWEESFHHVRLHFGKGNHDLDIEPFSPIKRRQAAATTPASAAPSVTPSFPAAPTTTPTNTEVHKASIDHAWIDTSVVPPKFLGVDASSLNVPAIPVGLTMNCNNCSLAGSVDLTFANFSTGNGNDTMEIYDFLKDGTLEFAVNDIAAHMELLGTVDASASHDVYKAPFPDIPLSPFSIPGIATVGPVLRPALSIGVEVSTQLQFSYGFDLSLPGTASITLDIRNPGNSSVVGFQNPQLTALPFQAQIDNLTLSLSVGFSPQLLLTANVLGKLGDISAGAFLDLPKITATFSQVDHVDDKCNPTNNTDTYKEFLHNSLTNIVPSVELGVGVLADARVDIPDVPVVEDDATHSIFSTGYPLPTACLSFDKAKKTYGAAAASATGKGGGSKSDATGLKYDDRLLGTSFGLVVVSWVMFSFF